MLDPRLISTILPNPSPVVNPLPVANVNPETYNVGNAREREMKRLLLVLAIISLLVVGCQDKQYDLTISSNGSGSINPSAGTYTFNDGKSVTITATPASGWKFDGWSGDASGDQSPLAIEMDEDKNIIALFSRIKYGLTMSTNGEGTTTPPIGVNTYYAGDLVNITATPAKYWKFDGWSGDSAGADATTNVQMNANNSVTANFSKIKYLLALTANGSGTTTPTLGQHNYDAGTMVDITAIPADGWKFDNWSGDMSGTSASLSIEMNENCNISANFSRIEYTLTINLNGQGVVTPKQGQITFHQGSAVTVSATPADGWGFSGWSGDVTNSSPTTTVVVNSDMTVTANFYLTSTMSQQFQSPMQATLSKKLIPRTYQWSYGWDTWTWEFPWIEGLYDLFRALPRPPTADYSVYVTNPYDDPLIEMLVERIEEAAQRKGYSEYETVSFVAAFVQSLPYTSDSVTTGFDEYPRYPIETLVDNGGDCEDTSILMAALLNEMGYGTILISPPNHLAVGVLGSEEIYGTYWELDGGKYYYLETTGDGFELGEIPPEYMGSTARLYELIPVPITTHEWESVRSYSLFGQSYYELEIRVDNLGTATAYGLSVVTAFDAGDNMIWNRTESSLFDLEPRYRETIRMQVKVPRDEYTRVIVSVMQNGFAISRTYSDWFVP